MAEKSVVEVVELSTNKRRKAILVGVDLDELDENSVNTIFGYFARSAETDESLNQSDCNSLRYAAATPTFYSNKIAERLVIYGNQLENLIENDKDIEKQDNEVIEKVFSAQKREVEGEEGTDSSEESRFDFATMRSHLFEIFTQFFSRERVMNSSPKRLLIDLALIAQYCYSFCKRLIQHAKETLGALLPPQVFSILCQVSSAILAHLASIHWKTIVQKVGGWVSLASTQDALGISLTNPRVYFGVALVSVAIGAYFYFTNTRS